MHTRVSLVVAGTLCAAGLLVAGCGTDTPADAGVDQPSKVFDSSDPVNPMKAKLEAIASSAQREARSALGPAIKKAFSSIRVVPRGTDGLAFVYTFRSPADVPKIAAHLDTEAPVFDAEFKAQISPELKRVGFAHPSATWTYLNPDGAVVWTHTVS